MSAQYAFNSKWLLQDKINGNSLVTFLDKSVWIATKCNFRKTSMSKVTLQKRNWYMKFVYIILFLSSIMHWELSTSIQIYLYTMIKSLYQQYFNAVKWNLMQLKNTVFVGQTVSLVVQAWSQSCIYPPLPLLLINQPWGCNSI